MDSNETNRDLIRFPAVLVQFGAPLKVDVYGIDQATGALQIAWPKGYIVQLSDASDLLFPSKRLFVLKTEFERALTELEASPLELAKVEGIAQQY